MSKLTDATLAKSIKVFLSDERPASNGCAPGFAELRLNAGNAAVAEIVSQLERLSRSSLQDPASARSWLKLCVDLRDQKMRASAKELWKLGGSVLSMVPFEDWIGSVPTPDFVEAARKSFNNPIPEFAGRLQRLGERLYETAGAEWLLSRGKPAEVEFLVDAALDLRPRPRGLDDARYVLAAFLKKDPKGARLVQVVRRAETNESRLAVLTEIATDQIMAHVGKLAQEVPAVTVRLIELFFSSRSDSPKSARKASLEMARFAIGILKAEQTVPEADPCLGILAKLAAEIRISMSERKDAGQLWTFEPAANRTEPGPSISLEGARQWAMVRARAEMDRKELGYLDSFAANVGLEEIGVVGARTRFDPKVHEDSEGGLLSGDEVTISASGWQLQGITVLKAKVRPEKAL